MGLVHELGEVWGKELASKLVHEKVLELVCG